MANPSINNFGLSGVGRILQFAKEGVKLVTSTIFSATLADGTTLTNVRGADPRFGSDGSQDFVTRHYLETTSTSDLVVANYTELLALTGLPAGRMVFCQDCSGDPIIPPGSGHPYGLYIWDGLKFNLVSNEGSAIADLGSATIVIPADSASTGTVYTLQSGVILEQISILVPSGLTGSPNIIFGTTGLPDIFGDINSSSLTESGTQIITVNQSMISTSPITYTYSSSTNSTSGNIIITIFFT